MNGLALQSSGKHKLRQWRNDGPSSEAPTERMRGNRLTLQHQKFQLIKRGKTSWWGWFNTVVGAQRGSGRSLDTLPGQDPEQALRLALLLSGFWIRGVQGKRSDLQSGGSWEIIFTVISRDVFKRRLTWCCGFFIFILGLWCWRAGQRITQQPTATYISWQGMRTVTENSGRTAAHLTGEHSCSSSMHGWLKLHKSSSNPTSVTL